jgi:hypothetical protein
MCWSHAFERAIDPKKAAVLRLRVESIPYNHFGHMTLVPKKYWTLLLKDVFNMFSISA